MNDEIILGLKNGVRSITFSNPKKKNAISTDGYTKVAQTLEEDARNDEIVATIFTGAGNVFSSGNDLTKSMGKLETMSFDDIIDEGWQCFKRMILALISYPKLLIAVVNGPAYGIGVTICALCDITYASNTATFQTPFVKLGLCIEGCGSYLMPRIMGRSKATELLLLGHKMTADEALQFNLISQIIPVEKLSSFIESLHNKLGGLSVNAIVLNKRLIMENIKDKLQESCERENKQLKECQYSDEFMKSLLAFTERKKAKL